jgi:hypothetical protein
LRAANAPADLVEPAFLTLPDGYDPGRTLGPEFAAVATLAGFSPDPEQQLLLDVNQALDKHGRPLVFQTVVIAPRQNLKTGFLKQRSLGNLFVRRRPLSLWTAHKDETASRAALDLEKLILAAPQLLRRVQLSTKGRPLVRGAHPAITLKTGEELVFRTRTGASGQGLTSDDLIIDEAFAADGPQMGAVLPTLLAVPGGQVVYTSSACHAESEFLWSLIERGRAGDGRLFYIEWACPPAEVVCDLGEACDHARGREGCGCDKPEVIRLGHPAVTRGRISIDKVFELRTLPPDQYVREIMGWHDEIVGGASPITGPAWRGLLDVESQVDGPVMFGLAVPFKGAAAVIASAGRRTDGRKHVEVVDFRDDTKWVPARLAELVASHGGAVAVDTGTPAGALVGDIEAAGVEVRKFTARLAADAFGAFVNDIREKGLHHIGQPQLDTAVETGRTRFIGEGLTTWDKRITSVPAVAVTLAAHALTLEDDQPLDNVSFMKI